MLDFPVNIIFEDNHLLVVEKPIGLPVQEDNLHKDDLLNILKEYLKEKYHKPGNVYLGLVHRLDQPVGGVMVFAKTSKAASRLSESLRNHQFKKVYYAVVCGIPPENGTFEDYLIKDKKNNTSKVTTKDLGKIASLDYQLIETNKELSLVQVFLKTGRSHQIRVQFSHHGYPLYGDQKYNQNVIKKVDIALYATKLSFPHPITKEMVTFTYNPPKTTPWILFNNLF